MSLMAYRGYFARVEYDADDEIFHGRIFGINDVVGFHADTVKGLKTAFAGAVEDYVETCKKAGKEPDKVYSGKVMFRVSPQIYADAAMAAEASGQSLNEWAEEALRQAAEKALRAA